MFGSFNAQFKFTSGYVKQNFVFGGVLFDSWCLSFIYSLTIHVGYGPEGITQINGPFEFNSPRHGQPR